MRALDLRDVEKPGGISHEQPAGKRELGERLESPLADRARAVGDPVRAPARRRRSLERGADLRMGLESLELLERAEMRVGVVEPDHESHRDLVVFEVIEERAAVRGAVERPSQGVHDQPRLVLRGVDLPQLLDADPVGLRVCAGAQVEAFEQRLGQMTAAALGEDCDPRVQLDPGLESPSLRFPVASDAHVLRCDSLDRAVVVEQHLGGRKLREISKRRAPPPALPANGKACRG